MNFKKYLCVLCAAVSAASFASCSSSDSSSSSADSESTSSDTKVEVYLSSDGTPYYVDEDGTKWMLFSTQMDSEDDDYSEEESYIYDAYDVDGISFDIPDSWVADGSYEYPVLLHQDEDENVSYDETISIMPTEYLFYDLTDLSSEDEFKEALTEDYLKEFFDSLLEDETYDSYEITEYGTMTVTGKESVYFDMTAAYTISYDEDDESDTETVTYRSRYIVVPGVNSQSIAISSLDTDESFELVIAAFTEIQETLVLPTDEETTDDEDTDEETEDEETEEETEEE